MATMRTNKESRMNSSASTRARLYAKRTSCLATVTLGPPPRAQAEVQEMLGLDDESQQGQQEI